MTPRRLRPAGYGSGGFLADDAPAFLEAEGSGPSVDVRQVEPARDREDSGDVVELSCGGTFTCARRSDDSIWCWGSDYFGELGDGDDPDFGPGPVVGLP